MKVKALTDAGAVGLVSFIGAWLYCVVVTDPLEAGVCWWRGTLKGACPGPDLRS